jgi:uncharacterized protein YjiS (DUF1127 family)
MLHELTNRILERIRINRDIRRLRSLDDRLLKDAGVERHEIVPRVRGLWE